ncbi:hypothetical protein DM826_07510 [Halonotius aquaticus]|uniref:Uncharacterized protein n=1 Tax=Halonotius aquaticus TaxID=2216978 RepID=A0A3A6QB51_9EURY|nr:hypothetical protein [Halonotius aquaticus]RJX43144.1 hypothetical protein DM826_07510 [Halonotius aquaticus]
MRQQFEIGLRQRAFEIVLEQIGAEVREEEGVANACIGPDPVPIRVMPIWLAHEHVAVTDDVIGELAEDGGKVAIAGYDAEETAEPSVVTEPKVVDATGVAEDADPPVPYEREIAATDPVSQYAAEHGEMVHLFLLPYPDAWR